jgi:hypothetical protein
MLISVKDVKDFLGITVTTDDDKLLANCKSAQDEAGVAVDYQLEGSTFTEILDSDGTDIIQLRNLPVKSITSIYQDFDRLYPASTLIADTDYAFNPKTGIVTGIAVGFSEGINNIKAIYLAGYNGLGATAYTALPDDLKQALVYLASALYLEGKAGVNVFENQELIYRPSYMKKEAYKILGKYRRISV